MPTIKRRRARLPQPPKLRAQRGYHEIARRLDAALARWDDLIAQQPDKRADARSVLKDLASGTLPASDAWWWKCDCGGLVSRIVTGPAACRLRGASTRLRCTR